MNTFGNDRRGYRDATSFGASHEPPRAEAGPLVGALAAVFSLWVAGALPSPVWTQGDLRPVNFTIVFIGDQGLSPNAEAVLNLIRNEGANAVLHLGNFDYFDNPADFRNRAWPATGPKQFARARTSTH